MNKEEFELLVGREASESEFRVAEATYMAMPDSVDKKKFAEKWKSSIDEFYEVEVFDALAFVIDSVNKTEKEAHEKVTKLIEDLSKEKKLNAEFSEHSTYLQKKLDNSESLIECIKSYDKSVVLKSKLKLDFHLTEEEKEEIISYL